MFTKLFARDVPKELPIKEGDLYKTVTILGKTFALHYGYYEDFERYSPYNEPIPIYPNFLKEPVYTEDGTPIVTEMQDICPHYEGRLDEDSCAACRYFRRIEDLFGICTCRQKRRVDTPEQTDGALRNPNHTQGGNTV